MADEKNLDLPGDLDRLLRSAMAVEPSPEFLPRVRERVAAGPRPIMYSWRFAGMSLVAAAALLLALWPVQTPAPSVAALLPAAPPSVELPAAAPRPAPQAAERPVATAIRRRPARVVVAERPSAPEVIVDPRQGAALATLIRLVDEGVVTDRTLVQTPQSTASINEQVLPLRVAPVAVSPIAVGGVLPARY